jgi:hypothetical protein
MFWANEFVLDLNLERHHTNMIKAGSAKGEGRASLSAHQQAQ